MASSSHLFILYVESSGKRPLAECLIAISQAISGKMNRCVNAPRSSRRRECTICRSTRKSSKDSRGPLFQHLHLHREFYIVDTTVLGSTVRLHCSHRAENMTGGDPRTHLLLDHLSLVLVQCPGGSVCKEIFGRFMVVVSIADHRPSRAIKLLESDKERALCFGRCRVPHLSFFFFVLSSMHAAD